jgi:hypothetical protein
MKRIITGFACFVFIGQALTAQSIYSFQGLGSLNHRGMPNNFAMGEVGIGTPADFHVNTVNPAHLVYNGFSSFQFGFEVDRRKFKADSVSGSESDGSIRFMAYAFPIIPGKWSSSFGVLPYSNVSYNTSSSGEVEGNEDVFQFIDNRGNGGLTNFYWSNGFQVMRNVHLGIQANFTFGSITRSSIISIAGTDVDQTNVSFQDNETYSDLNLLFGASYRQKIKDQTFLNYGIIYSSKNSLNGTSRETLTRLTNSSEEIDEIEVSSGKIGRALPQVLGFGVSFQKLDRYTIGVDVETQAWSDVSKTETFNDLFKLSVGANWIPDARSVNSYFERTRYYVGFNYQKLPYIVNNQALTDFGINFGASLPVSGYSSIDLAFKVGKLGETNNGLIKENYFKVVIGATINDRWFIKRKYD